jgi:hypothetical protein
MNNILKCDIIKLYVSSIELTQNKNIELLPALYISKLIIHMIIYGYGSK